MDLSKILSGSVLGRLLFLVVMLLPIGAQAGHLFTQAQTNTPVALTAGQGIQVTQLTYEGAGTAGLVRVYFTGSNADTGWSAGDAIKIAIGSWNQTFSYDTMVASGGTQNATMFQITSSQMVSAGVTASGHVNWTVVATAGRFTFEGYRITTSNGSTTLNGTGAGPINQSQVVDASQLGGGGGGGGASVAVFTPVANSPQKDVARVLDALNGNAGGQMGGVINTLGAMSEGSRREAMTLISPERSAALGRSSMQTMSSALDTVQVRLDSLRSGVGLQSSFRSASNDHMLGGHAQANSSGGETGAAAGDNALNQNMWMKAFGSRSYLDARDGFAGSTSNVYGMMIGYDRTSASGWLYGASLSYAKTDVSMEDFRQGDGAHVGSYQLTGYFGRSFDSWYLEGLLAYANQNYKTSRNTHLTGIASGDFDGHLSGMRLVAGMPFVLQESLTLTPFVGVEAFYAKQNAYTESGAGVLALEVDKNGVARRRSLVGAELGSTMKLSGGSVLRPSVKFTWRHEFEDSAGSANTAFVGGGGQFSTTGQKAISDVYALTSRVNWEMSEAFGLSLELGAEAGAGYTNVNGQVYGRWRF